MIVFKVALLLLIFGTLVCLRILVRYNKIHDGKRRYNIIEICGVIIPFLIYTLILVLDITDVYPESVIVVGGIWIITLLYYMFLKKWCQSKHNYLIFVCVVIVSFIIMKFTNRYMLRSVNDFATYMIIITIASTMKLDEYKFRMTVVGLAMFAVFLIKPLEFLDIKEKDNKVGLMAIRYAIEQGYNIEEDDIIQISGAVDNNKLMDLAIIRDARGTGSKVESSINLIYQKGKIVEIK